MAIFRFLLQQEALISLTNSLSCQQSPIYNQRHKNVRKFNKRIISNTQVITLQNVCPFYHSIWVSALIFQRSTTLLNSQKVKENAEKSGFIDYRSVSHLIVMESWGYS